MMINCSIWHVINACYSQILQTEMLYHYFVNLCYQKSTSLNQVSLLVITENIVCLIILK